ncbi:MAG: hypothetical protein KGZ73_08855 [Rhizobiales bacterium]|nr:hypothetical protein [Hyphomicrobiales bacterium]
MKRIVVAALAIMLLAIPATAEAQQKKKQNDDQNPLIFLVGIFSAGNCIITCGGAVKTVATTTWISQEETFVTTVTNKKVYGSYLGGAMACTFLWPFINHLSGGEEPTSEEAALITLGCWVPGLGIVLHLQNQNAS